MAFTPFLYLASYAASLLGNSIAAIALPLIVLQSTGSLVATGTVAVATSVPAFLVGLAAGVVIDRINRRTSSVVADVLSAASMAALPVVDHNTGLSLGWFVLFGILGALGDIPGLTAREAMLPAIVRNGRLTSEQLVGLRESTGALMVVVGPAAAGTLMMLLPGSTVLWITAGTSLLAAALTLLIPSSVGAVVRTATPAPDAASARVRSSAWTEHLAGWRTLFASRSVLRASTVLSLVMVVALAAMQGLVLPAHFALHGQPAMLGFVLSALAAGTLVGGVAFAMLGGRLPRRVWFVASVIGTVLALGALSSLASTGIIVTSAAVFGMCAGALGSLTGVLMIEAIPETMRGRIMGTQNSLMMLAAPLGIVGVSVLGEQFDLRTAAVCMAIVWAIAGICALALPTLRSLGPHAIPMAEAQELVANEKQ